MSGEIKVQHVCPYPFRPQKQSAYTVTKCIMVGSQQCARLDHAHGKTVFFFKDNLLTKDIKVLWPLKEDDNSAHMCYEGVS